MPMMRKMTVKDATAVKELNNRSTKFLLGIVANEWTFLLFGTVPKLKRVRYY